MTSRLFASTLASSVLLGGACGESVLGSGASGAAATIGTSTTTGSGGSGGSGGSTAAAGGGSTTTGSGGGSPPIACDELVADLAGSIGPSEACTAVVRMAYATKQPIGFAIVCGPKKAFTVEEAQATAEAEQLFGNEDPQLGHGPVSVVSPPYPNDPDELVFYAEPGDYGGVAALSADTGLPLFGGGIWWAGTGDVAYPKSFRPPSELGVGCFAPAVAKPKVRLMDVGHHKGAFGVDLTDAVVGAAFDVAWSSAAAGAFGEALSFGDSMVLFYAPSLGDEMAGLPLGFDPASAELVVFLNAR